MSYFWGRLHTLCKYTVFILNDIREAMCLFQPQAKRDVAVTQAALNRENAGKAVNASPWQLAVKCEIVLGIVVLEKRAQVQKPL